MPDPRGYWWQCQSDPTHWTSDFKMLTSFPLGTFFFELAESSWDQTRLTILCRTCRVGAMRITYEFPGTDRLLFSVHHIVGLNDYPDYIPMLWETAYSGEAEHAFDFKYVRRAQGGRIATLGLNRPAVFYRRSDFPRLFEAYRRVVGKPLWGEDGP